MIVLQCPIPWGGRLLPAGASISLPAWLEEQLLAAGNAVRPAASSPPSPAEPDVLDGAAPPQADGGETGDLEEQGEKKKSKKAQQASEPPAELGLGR